MYVSNYQLLQYICLDLTFDKLSIRLSVLIINFKINSHCTFFRNHLIYTLDCLSFIFSFSLFSFFVYLSNWFRINLITYFLLLLINNFRAILAILLLAANAKNAFLENCRSFLFYIEVCYLYYWDIIHILKLVQNDGPVFCYFRFNFL